ncbi:MAG: bL35 family ribosomal protein [Patescibacteria group bacterium]
MKTHQATAKRVKVTKSGKLLKRHGGQDHFNGRDKGKITRKKRRDQSIAKQYVKNLKGLMPQN